MCCDAGILIIVPIFSNSAGLFKQLEHRCFFCRTFCRPEPRCLHALGCVLFENNWCSGEDGDGGVQRFVSPVMLQCAEGHFPCSRLVLFGVPITQATTPSTPIAHGWSVFCPAARSRWSSTGPLISAVPTAASLTMWRYVSHCVVTPPQSCSTILPSYVVPHPSYVASPPQLCGIIHPSYVASPP